MYPEEYKTEVDNKRSNIVFHDGFGNLIYSKGTTHLNKWGMKEFDAAIKRIAAASNIKTINTEDDER